MGDAPVRPRRPRMRAWAVAAVSLLLGAAGAVAGERPQIGSQSGLEERRLLMVREVARSLRANEAETGLPHPSPRILATLAQTPRHEFTPPSLQRFAYDDRPLRIAPGQTLTQPTVAAAIADLAAPTRDSRVLLIGVSGGYDAAILAQLSHRLHIVEIDPAVLEAATARLRRLGYTNIEPRVGDGYYGWPAARMRFDAIVVRWSIDHVPGPLLRQLKPGGRMVIPVGADPDEQDLLQIERRRDGSLREWRAMRVRFMPMPGGQRI